ncbi:MAG: pseudouridine synthase [Sandaracinaceae bacterium]
MSDPPGALLTIDEPDDGSRLDVVLVRRVHGMSRARARRLIQQGQVLLNGRAASKGDRLSAGDEVRLSELPTPTDFDPLADDGALAVAYEDAHLVIVDKPAGIPTHPLRPDETATLANRLLARYPEMRGVGYQRREPGILHRLDNDTSGLLIAARTAEAFDALLALLKDGAIDKGYQALVDGSLAPRRIDHPIAKHPSDPRRVHVCVDGLDRRIVASRPAVTEIERTSLIGERTLAFASAERAVRHQVRAHLASIGHPLVGDWLYGGTLIDGLGRHFLHAYRIAFVHPFGGAQVDVEVPLPVELAALVEDAR